MVGLTLVGYGVDESSQELAFALWAWTDLMGSEV